jgi:hypothetical protein
MPHKLQTLVFVLEFYWTLNISSTVSRLYSHLPCIVLLFVCLLCICVVSVVVYLRILVSFVTVSGLLSLHVNTLN